MSEQTPQQKTALERIVDRFMPAFMAAGAIYVGAANRDLKDTVENKVNNTSVDQWVECQTGVVEMKVRLETMKRDVAEMKKQVEEVRKLNAALNTRLNQL